MHIQNNYLRWHRKRSQLTQADIGFIMQLPDYSNISRAEKGVRGPSIEMLIVYHLLFDVSIESIVEREKRELRDMISRRMLLRLEELRLLPPDEKLAARISFLATALTRLSDKGI